MIQRSIKRINPRALVVDDELTSPTAEGRAVRALVEELQGRGMEVVEAASAEDGMSVIVSDSAIHTILMDWTLGDDKGHAKAKGLLKFVRSRNDKIPIFLLAERGEATAIPIDVMEMVDEYVWTLEDTAAFVGGRVVAASRRYLEVMLPPLAAALMKFGQEYEYSWHTPGHTGGTAFLKSPVGRIFFDYFGENLLRSDLSISVGDLGSLLDHTGPIGEHEKYAARVFGAHRTYCVTNGTSTSNRVIFTAAVGRGQIALCDRNCHKSIEHGLVLTGGIPTYLVPLRNRYGIIGPIPPERLKKEAIKAAIKANPLVLEGHRGAGLSTRSSPTPPTTASATTPAAWRNCSIRASTGSTSTRRGTPTRGSIRSTATATPCTATRRITRGRRCSRRTPRTSCLPRCRRPRCCTSATGAAPSRMRGSTNRS